MLLCVRVCISFIDKLKALKRTCASQDQNVFFFFFFFWCIGNVFSTVRNFFGILFAKKRRRAENVLNSATTNSAHTLIAEKTNPVAKDFLIVNL